MSDRCLEWVEGCHGSFGWKADTGSDSFPTMLKWIATAAGLFLATGVVINVAAVLLSNGSFALTAHNWSLAISIFPHRHHRDRRCPLNEFVVTCIELMTGMGGKLPLELVK